jgi:TonB-linked SusC/RagA family outer membrane protein
MQINLCGEMPLNKRLLPKQILRVMKLTGFILIIVCVHVSAAVFSQNITLNKKNAPLSTVLADIQQQTGYDLFYKDKLVNDTKITISIKNEPLAKALSEILDKEGLAFTIDDKTITIKEKQPTPLEPLKSALNLEKIDITGKITDETGQPLPSATVIVKGTSNSTITDVKGNFTLKRVDNNAVLKISFIGYLTKEINANGDLSNIKMEVANSKLDAVQVIAYGQTSQRLSTGDISVVSAKDIEEQPVADPLLTLQGRVPGLFITPTSGFTNSPVNVQVMGQNSIAHGNEPLYVIDGVPYTPDMLPPAYASGVFSAFSFLNPSIIESISVLKDADATAIYGSRAANGAILITTKKGKAGETRVDIKLQNGWAKDPRHLDLLNTQQYVQLREEALKNDGISAPGPTDYDINGVWDQSRNTDWQKVLLGGTAQYTDLQGTISGGSANTQFLVNVGDHRETTVLPGNFADQKTSLHFSLNNCSNNQKFKLQLTGSYLLDNNDLPVGDPTQFAVNLAPDAPALRNSDGSINWAPDQNGNSTWGYQGNPLVNTLYILTSKTSNLTSNAIISYNLIPGLDLKSNFGYNNQQNDQLLAAPLTIYEPAARPYSQRFARYTNNNLNSWIIEPQVSYNKQFGKGKFQGIIGSTVEQNNADGKALNGTGYTSDSLLGDIAAATTVTAGATQSVYKYNALFGRITYNWDNKYILNVTARRDGSSRFGSANRFHDFWSAGGAWLFSSETAVKDNFPALSFGKLSGSYGTTGNDQIGDYSYLSVYNPVSAQIPYQAASSLLPNGLSNPYLQWEETRKLRIGLDLGFLNDRILFTASYFRNRSSNELLSVTIPQTTGFGQLPENFPATVQNSGLELTLNTINIQSGGFKWSSAFNLTVPRNKLVAFPGLANSTFANRLIVGQPVSISKVFDYAGIDPQTGIYLFKGANDKLTSNPDYPGDLTKLVNTDPKFYGGLNNSLAYKGFQLDFFIQFVKQIANNSFERFGILPGISNVNQPVTVLNRWQKPGDQAVIQKANSDYSLAYPGTLVTLSDAAFSDASYIRLKTVSLSWRIPDRWNTTLHTQNVRVFLQGQNLLTITPYKGLDPEIPGIYALPVLRVMTMGIDVGF